MISVTFDGAPAWLIELAPRTLDGFELTASLPADVEAGLTAIETRRLLGDTLRLSLRYSAVLLRTELPKLRNACQALKDSAVLMPLWPAGFNAGDSPAVTASYYALIDDTGAPEIKAHADLPFSRTAYPLLVGILDDVPVSTLYDDERATVSFSFVEDSTRKITPPTVTFNDGPDDSSGSARPLWPLSPDWASAPKSGGAMVAIDRQAIGYGRHQASSFYDQPARRPVDQAFTLEGSDVWNLLGTFKQLGSAANFWLPAALSDCRLADDVDSADTTLAVDDADLLGDNTYLLLTDNALRVPVVVASIAGDVLTLGGAVGEDFDKDGTRVESLILARLNAAQITIKWKDGGLATSALRFIEVPWEASGVTDETEGSSFGNLATCAYLYRFSIAYPGATQYFRFTDFERDLSYGGNSFTAQNIEHGQIVETATLERQQCSIKSRMFSGNPMSKLLPFGLEWPLVVEIFECRVSGNSATNLVRVFFGEVDEADSITPPFIEVTAASYGQILERQIPRRLMQTGCNWTVFEGGCGLDKADWTWQGSVASYDASTLTISLTSVARVSGPSASLVESYFAGGYLVIGSGSSAQYRWIAYNDAESGGAMDLTVATPFTTNPAVAATVTFYPGCPGTRAACVDKFDNLVHFGGFPFIPAANPTSTKIVENMNSAGKK